MSDKPQFFFEEENTEGKHKTSFRFDNTEIKKGDFAVATHLADLYDCDVTTRPPEDGQGLIWDETPREDGLGRWVPGEAGGCDIIEGELFLYVYHTVLGTGSSWNDESLQSASSSMHYGDDGLDKNEFFYDNPYKKHPEYGHLDEDSAIGTYANPFPELQDALDWLTDNCKVITDRARVNIIVMGVDESHRLALSFDVSADDPENRYWYNWKQVTVSHPYSHRIFIYGQSLEQGKPNQRVDNVENWHTNPLFDETHVIKFYCYMNLGAIPNCSSFQTAYKKFDPWVVVKGGKTLGGMYNFKFEEPSIDVECSSSSSSSGESSSSSTWG